MSSEGTEVERAPHVRAAFREAEREAERTGAWVRAATAGADTSGWDRLDEQALRGRAQALAVWAR